VKSGVGSIASIMVSWETFVFVNGIGAGNAQAELFADGAVNICYGSGTTAADFNNGFAAGIEGGTNDPYWHGGAVAIPLNDQYFKSQGITSSWPTSECYCFTPAPTAAPSALRAAVRAWCPLLYLARRQVVDPVLHLVLAPALYPARSRVRRLVQIPVHHPVLCLPRSRAPLTMPLQALLPVSFQALLPVPSQAILLEYRPKRVPKCRPKRSQRFSECRPQHFPPKCRFKRGRACCVDMTMCCK
jgi:hypothetical protein